MGFLRQLWNHLSAAAIVILTLLGLDCVLLGHELPPLGESICPSCGTRMPVITRIREELHAVNLALSGMAYSIVVIIRKKRRKGMPPECR